MGNTDAVQLPVFRKMERKDMKEICKNCMNCKPTYKKYYCDADGKRKTIKLQGTCEYWRPKR